LVLLIYISFVVIHFFEKEILQPPVHMLSEVVANDMPKHDRKIE